MQIVIPEELTGSTEYAAGSQLSRSLTAMADVFAKQSAQSAQRERQMDESLGALRDSNDINSIVGGSIEDAENLPPEAFVQLLGSGNTDAFEWDGLDRVRELLDYKQSEITDPIRRSLFIKERQKAEYQASGKIRAIIAEKINTKTQEELDTYEANAVDDAVNGYIEPEIPFSSDPDAHLEAVAADRARHQDNAYLNFQSRLSVDVARGGSQVSARLRDAQFLRNVTSRLADQGRLDEADYWAERHRDAMTPASYLNDKALIQQKRLEADAADLKTSMQSRFVDNPENLFHEDGTPESSLERWRKAVQETASPDFGKGYEPGAVKRARESIIGQYAEQRDQYRNKLPEVLGGLLSDVMNRKITSEQLMNDHNFRYLNYPEKTNVRNFTEALQRADAAEAVQEGSLNMKERQDLWRKQQEDAVNKAGEIRTNIARGLYANPAEMLPEYSRSDNPLILKQYPQAMAEYKLIQGNRDLKANLDRIATAADQGVLHADGPDQNMAARGSLQDDLMDMYKSDNTFRGDKMEKWVKEKIRERVKKTAGRLLESLVFGNR